VRTFEPNGVGHLKRSPTGLEDRMVKVQITLVASPPQPSKSLKILIFLEQADEGFGTIVNGVATGSPPYRPTHWCLLVGRGVRKIEGWIWGIAHIYFLISLRNRLIVATQWLWPTSLSSAARG
jgi:hypothetical protein